MVRRRRREEKQRHRTMIQYFTNYSRGAEPCAVVACVNVTRESTMKLWHTRKAIQQWPSAPGLRHQSKSSA